jgi:hydrogenase nickel incorporation protein HypA/HybF
MHEAAIAQSVIEIAEGVARQRGSANIRKIKLRVGEFRGVVGDALEFSFQVLKKGTLAENAELEIETVRLRVECRNCMGIEVAMNDFNLLCPGCGELLNITAGREMHVEYVEIN